MKTRKFLWAVLPMMAAALAMTACGGDDDTDTKPVPVSPTDPTDKTEKTEKSIPYTVTVKGDPETTRATVNADGKTMNFAADDELYISDGGDIHGVLTLQSGAGSDAATFSGTLYYEASTPPDGSTSLTATLVSSNDKVAVITDGKVTGFTYPTENNVCSTLADAVSEYSQLTGTANYGSTFTLSQTTAFLKFTVNLEDGTLPTDKAVAVSVTSDGSTTIGEGSVSASGSAQFIDVQAVFYVPVEGGTVISTDANMWVGSVGTPSDESIEYGSSTNKILTGGNVYTVSKTKDFVRLWADGPLWATKNVGASSVTGYGNYYQWGETDPVTNNEDCGWNNKYEFWASGTTNDDVTFTKYVPTGYPERWGNTESATPDNIVELEAGDDVATKKLGSPWHMPTEAEFNNLISNTDYEWTTVSGINGGMFKGKDNLYAGKAIFLPAAGYRDGTSLIKQGTRCRYWSSSLYTNRPANGRLLSASSESAYLGNYGRCSGLSVRSVRTN